METEPHVSHTEPEALIPNQVKRVTEAEYYRTIANWWLERCDELDRGAPMAAEDRDTMRKALEAFRNGR